MSPRPRSFNEDEVLGRAKELFWKKGFEATSMQDLVDHMMIGRQSLYNTFGDKHTLFMRALEQYVEIEGAEVRGELGQDDSGLPQIETYMGNVISMMEGQSDLRACFMVNSILELAPHDPQVREAGNQCRTVLYDSFKRALENGIASGEVKQTCNVHATSLLLIQVTMGFSPMHKSGASADDLRAVLRSTLAPIRSSAAVAQAN